MKRAILIEKDYLYIPVKPGRREIYFDLYLDEMDEEHLFTELKIPYGMIKDGNYDYKFWGEIPVKQFKGRTLIIDGSADQIFLDMIKNEDKIDQRAERKPLIHFTEDTGWTNDPNGLVFQDGIYHFYYQYNPFNTVWNNMSWGHAVSKDLLHWEIQDIVMFPDEDGPIYSGCAITNERECLGLPKDALIYCYTAAGGVDRRSAGKLFTQKFAYSTDHGNTLVKMNPPIVGTIYEDSRDPKIFWHEESKAYIMVLWLRGNNFGTLRSEDLENWTLTQEITLEDGWECGDLFRLYDEEGNSKWFYWAAEGYYYAGDFDGYTFTQTQDKKNAYITELPYAAQTYSNVGDKTISIPWYRTMNDGRYFTSTYGIPVEFGFKMVDGQYHLTQKPVQQFFDQLVPSQQTIVYEDDSTVEYQIEENYVDVYKITLKDQMISFSVGEDKYFYYGDSGIIQQNFLLKLQAGYGFKELLIIIDDHIVEIFFDNGEKVCALWNVSTPDLVILDKKHIEKLEHYHIK